MNAADFLMGLARTSVEAAVLILLVLGAQRIFRRRLTPAWSCALWLLVAARLAAITWSSPTSLFNLLPSWATAAPEAFIADRSAAPSAVGSAASHGAAPIPFAPDSGLLAAVEPVLGRPAESAPGSGQAWWLVVWASGVLVLAAYVGLASARFARRLARLPPLDDPRVREILAAGCARLKLRRVPRVSETDAVATPALHGCLRPHLLLPRGSARRWSTEELRFVLWHELAHVRRADLACNWLATALQAIHWFNPLVWLALARWRADREVACDALVLAHVDGSRHRAYGHLLLQLAEAASVRLPRPGLVGILEGKYALQRRIRSIARPARPPGPFAGIGLFVALGAVGLTGAQVPATAEPLVAVSGLELANVAGGRNILFLVDASESMLGTTPEEVARWRGEAAGRKHRAPKWQRTAEALATLLAQLPPDARYRVVRFDDRDVSDVDVARSGPGSSPQEIAAVARRLQEQAPRSAGANLEAALRTSLSSGDLPDRIVLLTDGLPTTSDAPRKNATGVSFFEAGVRRLHAGIPVSVVLLPRTPSDPAAAGLYWELATSTRGTVVTASAATPPATHLAFVIDTSGSMRDIRHGGLWPSARRAILDTLSAQPPGTRVQLLDADGRFILARRGTGAAAWHEDTPELRTLIETRLSEYRQDTVSNPIPGIVNAFRFLLDRDDSAMRMGIVVLGDEFVAAPEPALRRLDELNPADAEGRRRVAIHAIGFPTTVRQTFSMGNTGVKFADVMRSIAQEHGGTFVALPEL